jgi:hypothetical protein
VIIDVQLEKPAVCEESPEDFRKQLATSHEFRLRQVHIIELQELRDAHNKKERDQVLKEMGLGIESDVIYSNKVILPHRRSTHLTNDPNINDNSTPHIKYFYVILPYLKQYNSFCGLCVKKTYFGKQKKPTDLILRCNVRCKGRRTCPFCASIYIYNSGRGIITASESTVHHRYGEKICRPMRAPLRSILKEKLLNGASVFRVRRDQDEKRSKLERLGNNFDLTGTSMSTIRTIKQEAMMQSSMPFNVETSLSNMFMEFQETINQNGIVKGAIQVISRHPRKVIVFTEASVRLYNTLMAFPDTIISWDATGGIVKQSGIQRVLYYELTVTLPGVTKENSLVPITFMISDSHSQIDVKHWLEHIKNAHKKVIILMFRLKPAIIIFKSSASFIVISILSIVSIKLIL